MSWVQGSLEDDGWLVNQTRMWWASHWSVRHGRDWREATTGTPVADSPMQIGRADGASGPGPQEPVIDAEPSAVWLTAESLGDGDPALQAHPDLPVIFVFDEPGLRALPLSGKRLVFVAECLAEGSVPLTDLAGAHPLKQQPKTLAVRTHVRYT